MGRPTVVNVGNELGNKCRSTSYTSSIPSVAGCSHMGTGNGSTTSDSTGNGAGHRSSTSGVGSYLKRSFNRTILKHRNPRAADLEFSQNGTTHVCPLSDQASTLMAMIHGCDWALVRKHIQTKKGGVEFTRAVEYDETTQAMSLDLMGASSASFVSDRTSSSGAACKGMSRNMSGYISPGVVSQSNFSTVKKQKAPIPLAPAQKGAVASQHNVTAGKRPSKHLVRGSTISREDSQSSLLSASDIAHGKNAQPSSSARSTGSGASGCVSMHGKIKTISSTPTILHLICTLYPPVQLVQRILSVKPAYSSSINNIEQTPLHLACACGASAQVVQCLLKHNKRLANRLDHRGRTALHLLCEIGIAKEQENGDLSDLEDDEDSPVKECIDFLTWAYPDATLVVDIENKTPLDYAIAVDAHPRMIAQLLKIQKAQLEQDREG
jgi:hypothetical protein